MPYDFIYSKTLVMSSFFDGVNNPENEELVPFRIFSPENNDCSSHFLEMQSI